MGDDRVRCVANGDTEIVRPPGKVDVLGKTEILVERAHLVKDLSTNRDVDGGKFREVTRTIEVRR